MKDRKRRQGIAVGGAAVVVALRRSIVFTIMLLAALAATSPAHSAAKESPSFASLQIEIWPEFDRRGAALVILKGELAANLTLPATVSLRIPASSGGPTAVAFATAPSTGLFNLAHDRTYGKDFITLRFKAPQRFIHVEFYDPIVTGKPDRSYTYVWPSDMAVGQLSARLQEPAGTSNLSVQPNLGAGVPGPDGLLYRTAELSAREAGKQLPIEIRYTKTDSRTSAEILGVNASNATLPATTGSSEEFPGWVLILAVAAALVMGAGVAALWWRRREKTFVRQSSGPGFCSQCRSRLASGDRFCSKCGAPVCNE